MKNKEKLSFKIIMNFLLGIIIFALGFNLFFEPYNLASFGLGGFSIIFEKLFKIEPGIFIFVMSVVLLLVSYLILGKETTKKSIVGSILYPLLVMLTKDINQIIDFQNTEIILIVVFGGVISGMGLGLIHKTGFTTGGTDVINQIISRYFKISIGKSMRIVNGIIIVSSAFLFGIDIAMYGIIILFLISMMTDKVILGTSESKFFHIFTNNLEEVHQYLINEIGAGVTIVSGEGGFSGEYNKFLMCIIPTKQYFLVKQGIKKIDEKAFFVVTDSYEVGNLRQKEKR